MAGRSGCACDFGGGFDFDDDDVEVILAPNGDVVDGHRETAVGTFGERGCGEAGAYWKLVWKELGEALGDLAGTGERVNMVSAASSGTRARDAKGLGKGCHPGPTSVERAAERGESRDRGQRTEDRVLDSRITAASRGRPGASRWCPGKQLACG